MLTVTIQQKRPSMNSGAFVAWLPQVLSTRVDFHNWTFQETWIPGRDEMGRGVKARTDRKPRDEVLCWKPQVWHALRTLASDLWMMHQCCFPLQGCEWEQEDPLSQLCPWKNNYCEILTQHPEILTGEASLNRSPQEFFGLIKCNITPPTFLFHPVLPYRMLQSMKRKKVSNWSIETWRRTQDYAHWPS